VVTFGNKIIASCDNTTWRADRILVRTLYGKIREHFIRAPTPRSD
jgi:hypothetical protein